MQFLRLAENFHSEGAHKRIDSLLCGFAKIWYENRTRAPDALLSCGLTVLAKTSPKSVRRNHVVDAFCAVLEVIFKFVLKFSFFLCLFFVVFFVCTDGTAYESFRARCGGDSRVYD